MDTCKHAVSVRKQEKVAINVMRLLKDVIGARNHSNQNISRACPSSMFEMNMKKFITGTANQLN